MADKRDYRTAVKPSPLLLPALARAAQTLGLKTPPASPPELPGDRFRQHCR